MRHQHSRKVFHFYYTVRRILWCLGATLTKSKNFNPSKTVIDISEHDNTKNEFSIPAGTGLKTWLKRFDERPFVQDCKTGESFIISMAVGHIPEVTDGLSKADFKEISESIRAYTICILAAQKAAHTCRLYS